ncbi:hypothetical protein AB0B31_36970 [Catellatospora citrea]|uniref:hypothetical protein n=1 Tax=Catellatospora citrea TaxID=53366 RepID=UPI0033CA8511
MAKNNRPDRDPREDRHEDAPHAGTAQHQAAGGMNAHSMNHNASEHEQHAAATATMPQKKEQAGNSPTSMKSKKGNQPKHNQPKR